MKRLKNFLENVFLWRSLDKFLWRPFFFFFWRSPKKFLWRPSFFFFWRALALVSLVLGLGLEHSCPWPRECLSSERLSLALDFFCVLGLESCVVDSTSGVDSILFDPSIAEIFYFKLEMARITKNASACCAASANFVRMLHRAAS